MDSLDIETGCREPELLTRNESSITLSVCHFGALSDGRFSGIHSRCLRPFLTSGGLPVNDREAEEAAKEAVVVAAKFQITANSALRSRSWTVIGFLFFVNWKGCLGLVLHVWHVAPAQDPWQPQAHLQVLCHLHMRPARRPGAHQVSEAAEDLAKAQPGAALAAEGLACAAALAALELKSAPEEALQQRVAEAEDRDFRLGSTESWVGNSG